MTQALRHPSDPHTHLRAEKKKKKRTLFKKDKTTRVPSDFSHLRAEKKIKQRKWASTLFRIYGQVYALALYVLESQDYGNIEERTMKIRSSI